MNVKDLALYAITDRSWLKTGESLEDAVASAILGGASIVQLREKDLTGPDLKALALKIQAVCRRFHIPFIINDNVLLAAEINADGAHVGASDMALTDARKLLGPNKILGATAKTIEQAKSAEKAGADYLGSGAIFGTSTKKDAKPMSMELLQDICSSVKIPVVAIGGIEESNISKFKKLPLAGAAVVSGIFAQEDYYKTARRLRILLHGKPIVHSITNTITINDVANILHAVGASPIMSVDPHEVEEVQTNSDALLINLGAIKDLASMKLAYKKALDAGHPIVIDPVGCAGNSYRRACLQELLQICSPSCIRGNYSEIAAIAASANLARGLDGSAPLTEETLLSLSKRLDSMIVASGEIDFLSDGQSLLMVESGSPLQASITGSGCMLSGVLAAECAFAGKDHITLERLAESCRFYGDTAKYAEAYIKENHLGTMSFKLKFMDEISKRIL